MAEWVIKRAASLVPVPWRNGLGVTRDVETVLHPDGSLRWQVSIADLVQDAPFSHFEGIDRVFTPIAGDPAPELAFEGGQFEACPLLVPKRFPGDVPTLSRIPAPGRAFNALADRRHHAIDVQVLRPGAGQRIAIPPASVVVLHCHAGSVGLGPERLEPGDSAIGPGDGAAVADGAATVILASFS